MKVSAIILAAGSSSRFGQNKMFYSLFGEPILAKTLNQFLSASVDEIIVVTKHDTIDMVKSMFSYTDKVTVIEGGNDRHLSTIQGLKAAKGKYVLIHDGARPFVSIKLINEIIQLVSEEYGVVPVSNSTDSIVLNSEGEVKYLDRNEIFSVQTPQAFQREKLLDIYLNDFCKNKELQKATDNGSVWMSKYPVKFVLGESENIKITNKSDVPPLFKVGNGYDLHRLVENRPLVLGGINLPFDKGLLGVSDADVVLHALMDAILSAANLKDIGHQFPPTDPKYKDIDSKLLLNIVLDKISNLGYVLQNVSITILAEQPKLSPHIDKIQESLANLLSIPKENVGLSATTLEGIGIVGREEGIAAYATVLLKK